MLVANQAAAAAGRGGTVSTLRWTMTVRVWLRRLARNRQISQASGSSVMAMVGRRVIEEVVAGEGVAEGGVAPVGGAGGLDGGGECLRGQRDGQC